MATFSRCSWYCGRLASISFMSFRLAAPSLRFRSQKVTAVHYHEIYPLNTAFSSKNLLKSAISLSIASRMCICRTSVHTVSESDSVAVLSSYAPIDDWNLYLGGHNKPKSIDMQKDYRRVFSPTFDRKEIIGHRLIREFMNKGGYHVH